ncbi:hypothetical protein BC830DRAFT_1168479 [Chytriomyces sp. MP71]|nr:hypothetical protein BC830DRAFT_1168479 [Chytriomyces sp. MP71]
MTSERSPLLNVEAIQPSVAVAATPTVRLAALDLLRGLLMVLMAIDHSKGFLANFVTPHEQWFESPDYKGNGFTFLTRFVTSFCAPGFFMLMGWGIALFVESRRNAGWSWFRILKHYALRGFVLIIFNEITMIPFELQLPRYHFITSVLVALGCCMFLAALFIAAESEILPRYTAHLSPAAANMTLAGTYFVTVALITVAPSLYVPKVSEKNANFSTSFLLWFLPLAGSTETKSAIISVYPPFPWMAHTLWGVGIGRFVKRVQWDSVRLALFNMSAGILMLSLALPLRYFVPWTSINPEIVTPPYTSSMISFLNNVKYPPSVVYTLITLGGNHIALALFFLVNPDTLSVNNGPLLVFGGSSLFFYVTHFWMYMGIAGVLFTIGVMPVGGFGGFDFWLCYALGLVIEYAMCMKYAAFKRETGRDSLWRLF